MKDLLDHALKYWGAGGLLLIPLAMVCLGIWGHFLRSRDRLTAVLRESIQLDREFESNRFYHVKEGGCLQAFLARVRDDIRAGAPARGSFHQREAECLDALRRDVGTLVALTAVAPLLGLLGTVIGMIGTFDAVSMVSGNTGGDVAGGISQALITTQFGLVVAVPGVFGISRLRALLRDVQIRLGTVRARVLTLLEEEGVEALV